MGVKIKFDERKLRSTIENATTKALNNRSYDVECPHCHAKINVHPGTDICPLCHNTVNLKLDIKF